MFGLVDADGGMNHSCMDTTVRWGCGWCLSSASGRQHAFGIDSLPNKSISRKAQESVV
jgi:hypothetical protein